MMPALSASVGTSAHSFAGFESLDANYIYCPNQFFDVCLPNYSRGVVRLVAYILFETLRLRDENGNPVRQDITVTYRDLIEKAGISRGSINKAIKDAVRAGFIISVTSARKKTKGQPAKSAQFRLRWDTSSQYHRNSNEFQGFFAGEGHRSPIPFAFFSLIIPTETRDVVKFVGTVLRHTVGYENQFGRRSQAPLLFTVIQRYAKFADRQQGVKAAKHCLSRGYIQRVERGAFGPDDEQRKPSTYAPRWLHEAKKENIGSTKTPVTVQNTPQLVGSKNTPGDQFKTNPRNGSKKTSADQSNRDPTRKIVSKSVSQQQTEGNSVAVALLREQGFEEVDAIAIAREGTVEQVERQIRWVDFRSPKNRLGMLRRAIEEDWSEPAGVTEAMVEAERDSRAAEARAERAALVESEARTSDERCRRKEERRQRLLKRWAEAPYHLKRESYERARNRSSVPAYRRRIESSTDSDPAPEVLNELETLLTVTSATA